MAKEGIVKVDFSNEGGNAMAQRIIHLLFGEMLVKRAKVNNCNRFLLGSILPDAYVNPEARGRTHFIRQTEDEQYVYFDFKEFQDQYGDLMRTDDFYLGYYMHLVQDALYRKFLYKDYDFREIVKCHSNVAILHNDYLLLNSYIIKKYGIKNTVKLIAAFEKEPINDVATFSINGFLESLKSEFEECAKGKTQLLTESMLDEFVEKYSTLCVIEIEKVKKKQDYLCPLDYKWKK